jgi:hypothetical protein
MALREFTDATGRLWTVWSVHPSSDVRLRSTRAVPGNADEHDLLRDGWLVFETPGERRRLVPIPDEWEVVDDDALAQLCARAMSVPTRRRLIE